MDQKGTNYTFLYINNIGAPYIVINKKDLLLQKGMIKHYLNKYCWFEENNRNEPQSCN